MGRYGGFCFDDGAGRRFGLIPSRKNAYLNRHALVTVLRRGYRVLIQDLIFHDDRGRANADPFFSADETESL